MRAAGGGNARRGAAGLGVLRSGVGGGGVGYMGVGGGGRGARALDRPEKSPAAGNVML